MFSRLGESLRKYPAYCPQMPKTVRGPPRGHPEPPIPRPCHPGTHLTYEQRRRIYSLTSKPHQSEENSINAQPSPHDGPISNILHGGKVQHAKEMREHLKACTTTRASHDRLVTSIPQSPIPEPNQSSDQDKVRFDDQEILQNASRQRLLIGHHAETGEAVYAYILQSGASQKVAFSAEDTRGQPNVGISHGDVARQHTLYSFNKTFPQDGRCLGRADKARLAIVVRWYFIATGRTKLRSPKSLQTFCKQFRSALRYIANRSESTAGRLPRNPSGQEDDLRSAGGTHVDESDIQSALLATMLSPSPSPTMIAKESLRWPSLSLEPPGSEKSTSVGGLPPSTATGRSRRRIRKRHA
ncbi:hypothetical protein PMIN06_012976 [Paraphaeosphaeria minitans]